MDRRRSLALATISATLALLLLDRCARSAALYNLGLLSGPGPGLEIVPLWKQAVVLTVLAAVFYASARIVHTLGRTERERRRLWPLALLGLALLGHATWGVLWQLVADDWSRDHYLPLRVERDGLAGTAWWDVTGGECGYLSMEVVEFESETRAVRHRYGGYVFDSLLPLYAALGVWPHGEWVASGEIRDGIITWTEEGGDISRERIHASRDRLNLDWIREDR